MAGANENRTERRVVTPNPDLIVVKFGKAPRKFKLSPEESASNVVATLAKVMAKPGTDRALIFAGSSSKPVYAYSVFVKDPTKIVREDKAGKKTIGRLVGGRFKAISTKGV